MVALAQSGAPRAPTSKTSYGALVANIAGNNPSRTAPGARFKLISVGQTAAWPCVPPGDLAPWVRPHHGDDIEVAGGAGICGFGVS